MIENYIKLVKFRYHLSFVSVILGALVFAPELNFSILQSLFLVYLSFNLFMYTGIYILNDLFDYKSDLLHPQKRKRVIPAGKIGRFHASLIAFITIIAGLLISFLFFKNLFYIYLLFLLLNLFYSSIAKKVPYLELLVNSLTHPLRLIMGIILVEGTIPLYLSIAYLFVALGFATQRRIFEMGVKGFEARKVLLNYTKSKLISLQVLSFIAINLIAFIDRINYPYFYLAMILFYIIFVFLLEYYSYKFRNGLKSLWLS